MLMKNIEISIFVKISPFTGVSLQHYRSMDFFTFLGKNLQNLEIKNRSRFTFSQRNESVVTWVLKSLITRASGHAGYACPGSDMFSPRGVATRDALRSLTCQFNLLYSMLLLVFFVCFFCQAFYICAKIHVRFWARSLATNAIFSKHTMIASHNCASRNRAY